MVQAARSGVQNIAEGSAVSATSKKTEIKLTQVARASLEELRLDYEDFLRQRSLPIFDSTHPLLEDFRQRRCASLAEVQKWVSDSRRVPSCDGFPSSCLAANGALSLLNVACHLLNRQVDRLAQDFENQGGFTERLYRTRKKARTSTD